MRRSIDRNGYPSPWAWITYEQVASELIELLSASDAVLQVAALRFDEQGQEAETRAESEYCRAMADAVRCLIRAQGVIESNRGGSQ